jgi:hypothetical protein
MTQATTDDLPTAIAAAGPAAVAAWHDFTGAEGFRAATRDIYRRTALRFLRWLEPQGIGLAQVSAGVVERYLAEQGIAPNSKVTYRTAVRRLFDALAARQAVPTNPTDRAGGGADDPLSLPTLTEMKAAIRDLDPSAMDDDPEMLDAGVVLLAGLHLGTGKIEPISRFTGVATERVAEFAERLRANGVWTPDGQTAGRWHQEGGEIALLIDILIALGMVECRPADDGVISVNVAEQCASDAAAAAAQSPAEDDRL